jgi:hypothetical protein
MHRRPLRRARHGAMNELMSRLVARLTLMLLALALMLAGLGFVFAAIYLSVARIIDPPAAALATGLAAFAVAMILLLIARRSGGKRRRPVARPAVGPAPADVATGAAELGAVLADEGRRIVAGHAKGATATALVAGLAVGISPRLRRTLWRLLR